jgi:hydrogenase expression/formation protein HypE
MITASCPIPIRRYDRVAMGHGSGGKLGADLLREVFLPAFGNNILSALEDQATVSAGGARLAFTTDSFVVRPLFFPGGDIGRLAVNGTINDLAVGGAVPLFLAAAFILEEGWDMAELGRIAHSMGAACREAGVTIVAGDTKVVDRGKGDKVFITTTGLGVVADGVALSASAGRPGDRVVLSGSIGDHGMAVMSVREGIEFETALVSDTAPLHGLVEAMLAACPAIRGMRDPTRGGLASSLNEIAAASRVGVRIREKEIPVRPEVAGACELLGLDPLYVANEGKLVAIVPAAEADRLVAAMRHHPLGREASVIGEIVDKPAGQVIMATATGGQRIISLLTNEQLPRIC